MLLGIVSVPVQFPLCLHFVGRFCGCRRKSSWVVGDNRTDLRTDPVLPADIPTNRQPLYSQLSKFVVFPCPAIRPLLCVISNDLMNGLNRKAQFFQLGAPRRLSTRARWTESWAPCGQMTKLTTDGHLHGKHRDEQVLLGSTQIHQ